jgi:phosphate transport system substrate-binding protein
LLPLILLQGLMDGGDLGPMSRAMNEQQLATFTAKFGYPPTGIKVAIDALAVYVNANNPVKSLTLTQVDNIFSSTCKRGGTAVASWVEIGSAELTGEWSTRPVSLFGRNSASGTYGFFKHVALMSGDFKPSVKEQAGSSAVVKGVANDLGGIGYSGVGYSTAGVRAVPLADGDQPAFEPTYRDTRREIPL